LILLDISESILKEYLIPKDHEKPRIEIGNYFLKWDDDNKSYGDDNGHYLTNPEYIYDKFI
jgi:hypothetical protein